MNFRSSKSHQYYLYHEGNQVFARAFTHERVLYKTCSTPQEAHDLVQQIINPENRTAQQVDVWNMSLNPADNRPLGYLHDCFQARISDLCKPHVQQAYQAQGLTV